MNTYYFNALIQDVEIRKFYVVDDEFVKNGKSIKYSYINLICDVGANLNRVIFNDKNTSNIDKYKVGMFGDVLIRIDIKEDFGKKCKLTLLDFIVKE